MSFCVHFEEGYRTKEMPLTTDRYVAKRSIRGMFSRLSPPFSVLACVLARRAK